MKIYIDLIMILNFFFDFLLLISVSIILRRNVPIKKIILAAFFGGLSMLLLFININSFELFCLKIIISVVMILVAFGYKSFRYTAKNFLYLYMASIILGGFLYFLNIEFSYKQQGMVFFHNGLSINVVFLIIFAPIILYIYIKQGLWLKNNYSNYYKVAIHYNNKIIDCNAYLDTGNTLTTLSNKPVVLLSKKIVPDKFFYLPYKSIDNDGMIKCFKADKIIINNKQIKNNVYVGLINEKIKIDGVECLLNLRIMEE